MAVGGTAARRDKSPSATYVTLLITAHNFCMGEVLLCAVAVNVFVPFRNSCMFSPLEGA